MIKPFKAADTLAPVRRVAMLVSTVAAMLSPSAFADRPQSIPVDLFSEYDSCGFLVVFHLTGTATYIFQPPQSDYKGIEVNWTYTYTNPATGKSVLLRQSGQESLVSEEITDDGLIIDHTVGTQEFRLMLPGGCVAVNVGPVATNYIYDAFDGSLVDMQIQRLSHSRADDIDARICDLLAP